MSTVAEQETVIRWSRGQSTVDLWTCDTLFKARLDRLGWKPSKVGKTDHGVERSWTYILPARAAVVRNASWFTPANVEKRSISAANARSKSPCNPPGISPSDSKDVS